MLIADVMMPKMNGVELAANIRKILPDIRVLLCLGYPQASLAAKGIEIGVEAFLQKPISLRALSEKVRELLRADSVKSGSG